MSFNVPDTLIPDPSNPLDFNRYGYARYNPLKYTDPSGHCAETPDDDDIGCWKLAQQIADEYGHPYEELIQWNENQLVELRSAYQQKTNPDWLPAFGCGHDSFRRHITIMALCAAEFRSHGWSRSLIWNSNIRVAAEMVQTKPWPGDWSCILGNRHRFRDL